jgi:hypothetical protein
MDSHAFDDLEARLARRSETHDVDIEAGTAEDTRLSFHPRVEGVIRVDDHAVAPR